MLVRTASFWHFAGSWGKTNYKCSIVRYLQFCVLYYFTRAWGINVIWNGHCIILLFAVELSWNVRTCNILSWNVPHRLFSAAVDEMNISSISRQRLSTLQSQIPDCEIYIMLIVHYVWARISEVTRDGVVRIQLETFWIQTRITFCPYTQKVLFKKSHDKQLLWSTATHQIKCLCNNWLNRFYQNFIGWSKQKRPISKL